MANSNFKKASIRLTFDNGFDALGKPRKKVKAYHNVSDLASATGIFESARVLTEFGNKPLMDLEKQSSLSIYA
ncbi:MULTISPECIES: DUF1659 domain-containing protein [Planomicrobium]|uniref:DUF1659 domain-containing protein n=1 Tax=Planomicrobium okeanokoites TaxID=244 RepID=A0ABV7KQA9_PLAOK|nr:MULTISPECIES: DUF1659 domain-containing protein [Planomicrobium]PKH08288.1 DUF1659 domain-containing protein [Planomicrobium sp. MB-3u-38]TAA71061.1 DUF1659 domain-containing protein [Planomicrobium okeanokoites]